MIDRNPIDIDPAEISESRVLLTRLGGELVDGDLMSIGEPMQSRDPEEAPDTLRPRIGVRFAIPPDTPGPGSSPPGGAIE